MSVGFPLVLHSNITGFTGAVGDVRAPNDPLAFQCPGKGAMLVEALSFSWDTFAPHEVMIMCGRAKLTNGYVSVPSMLTPADSRLWGLSVTPGVGAATWRFDVPMYVPVGTRLSFMWRAGGLTLTKVEIAAKCRHLPANYPEPKAVAVPWATAFRPVGTLAAADDTVASLFNSVIGDVTNNFRSPLRVRRFVGDGTSGQNIGPGQYVNDAESGALSVPGQAATQRMLARIQLRDWLGNNLVRDPTTLAHLCQAIRREWKVDFALPPTRSLFATMDERHAANVGAGVGRIQPSLALIGWRQEVIEEVRS